jgi:hypothetical protein
MKACYRLSYQKQRPLIHELRVMPVVADGPFSFSVIQRQVTQSFFDDALAAIGSASPRDDRHEATRLVGKTATITIKTSGNLTMRRAKGRPRVYGPLHYASLAKRYSDIENFDPRKERGESTREILVREYRKRREFKNVTVDTIAKWIRIARQMGFLTKARKRGKRGGQVTDLATNLIERSQQQ